MVNRQQKTKPSLTTSELYPVFTDYLDTVVGSIPKLTPNFYNYISAGLDEVVYDLYYREVPVEEATTIVSSVVTHLGVFLKN